MGHPWRGLSAKEEEGLWRGDLEGPDLFTWVSEKPSSLCTEKAEPQVGFQSPSASASGLGELMFCCGHRSVGELEMLCVCQASPGPQLGKMN